MEKFKKIWVNEYFQWCEFFSKDIENSNLKSETKEALKVGFPEQAAPFLDFGLFANAKKYIENMKCDKYWAFGHNGSGALICIDTSCHDSIVLITCESKQEYSVQNMNKNILELCKSLLLYRNFLEIKDEKDTNELIVDLENKFLELNPNPNELKFWYDEIKYLKKDNM